MAWIYDTTLATSKDKVRLLIGDTIETIPLLSDEEITATLTIEGSVMASAESLCRSLSARFGREADLETDVVKDRKTKQAEHFLTLAEKYALRLGTMAEFAYLGGVDSEGNETGPFFTRDMQLDGTLVPRELNNQ